MEEAGEATFAFRALHRLDWPLTAGEFGEWLAAYIQHVVQRDMTARRMETRSLYSSSHDLHALLTVDAAVVGSEESKAGAAVIKILLIDVQIRHWSALG